MSHMDEATRRANNNPAFEIAAMTDAFIESCTKPKNMVILGYSDYLKQYAHYC